MASNYAVETFDLDTWDWHLVCNLLRLSELRTLFLVQLLLSCGVCFKAWLCASFTYDISTGLQTYYVDDSCLHLLELRFENDHFSVRRCICILRYVLCNKVKHICQNCYIGITYCYFILAYWMEPKLLVTHENS